MLLGDAGLETKMETGIRPEQVRCEWHCTIRRFRAAFNELSDHSVEPRVIGLRYLLAIRSRRGGS